MGSRGTDFKLLEWLDTGGALGSKIRKSGPKSQKTGRGPNNFRCGLIEATISSLGERARCTKEYWTHVNTWLSEVFQSNPDAWKLTQK